MELKIKGVTVSASVKTDFIALKNSRKDANTAETLEFLLNFYKEKKHAPTPKKSIEGHLNASERLEMFVNAIIKHNESDNEIKFYIGQSFVRKELGVNMKSLQDYFNEHQNRIDKHHKGIVGVKEGKGITKYDNYKFRSTSLEYKENESELKRGDDGRLVAVTKTLKEQGVYDILRD